MTVQVAIAQINSTVGDFAGNSEKIIQACRKAHQAGADIVLTPELSLVGYPPEDLLLRPSFYAKSALAFDVLVTQLAQLSGLHVVVCYPLLLQHKCFNAASVVRDGVVLGTYCKSSLPNDAVFDEKRYFSPAHDAFVFDVKGVKFGINICEDTWSAGPPSRAKQAGAQVLLIPNGSPFHMHKQQLRYDTMRKHVCSQGLALVYANLSGAQDELVFDGNSFVLDAQGTVCAQLGHCVEEVRVIAFDGAQPVLQIEQPALSIEAQAYQALVLGVGDYVNKNGFPGVIIGLSGGVDSALTLAIAVDALGADRVHTVMMASPFTAEISWLDAREMARRLEVRYDEIAIDDCFDAFLHTLADQFGSLPQDTTEENIQARIRGTMLMALSNKHGGIVLTTGNKSEMAVGYCTLYGDMAGGFAAIKDVAKTLVYRLCAYRNQISDIIPDRILSRPPSAELRSDQTDQDALPPYEVLDPIMQMHMEENLDIDQIVQAGYPRAVVERIVYLIKVNEYKRRQAPVGVRITHRGFGRDWRYPITSKFRE
jgi:NAD+ synthase (glutamine-hydrolysing)